MEAKPTWRTLLKSERVKKHTTSVEELESLRALVRRDLSDATLPGLSDDRRFATAYYAALQLAKMVIACTGFRVSGPGHHVTTFDALPLAMGPDFEPLADYLDACRRKRNVLDYDAAFVATATEADELVAKVEEFQNQVEEWIAVNYPEFGQHK